MLYWVHMGIGPEAADEEEVMGYACQENSAEGELVIYGIGEEVAGGSAMSTRDRQDVRCCGGVQRGVVPNPFGPFSCRLPRHLAL